MRKRTVNLKELFLHVEYKIMKCRRVKISIDIFMLLLCVKITLDTQQKHKNKHKT